MPIIDIPGVGEVEYPDTMSQKDIDMAIQKEFFSKTTPQPQPATSQPPPSYMPDIGSVLSQAGMGAEYPMTYGQIPAEEVRGGMDQARQAAPIAGAIGGGLIGSTVPIPGAATFLSGIGGAAGEAVSQGEIPSLDKFAQDFGRNVAIDIAVKPFSWMASKAFDPIKQGFQMLRAGQLAERGLPIPASAISPTEKGIKLAKQARETYPGNKIVAEAHEKLKKGAEEMLGEFETKYITGVKKADVDSQFESWAQSMGGGQALVDLPNTLNFIQETLGKKFAEKNTFWQKKAATFLEEPTVQGLRDLWKSVKGGRDFDKTARQNLLKILDDDLLQYGDEVSNIRLEARKLSRISAKEKPLQDIIDNSYETVNGNDTFLPEKFARLWNSKKKKATIAYKYSSDEISDIDQFAEMMGVIGNELKQKVSSQGPTSLLGQAGGSTMLAGGLKMFGLPGTEILAGAGLALPGMKYLSSKQAGKIYQPGSRLYQQMLGEPSSGEMIPGLVNIGGKLILLKGSKLMEDE